MRFTARKPIRPRYGAKDKPRCRHRGLSFRLNDRLEVALNAQAALDGIVVEAEVWTARIEIRVENIHDDAEPRNRPPHHVRTGAPLGEVEGRRHVGTVLDASI